MPIRRIFTADSRTSNSFPFHSPVGLTNMVFRFLQTQNFGHFFITSGVNIFMNSAPENDSHFRRSNIYNNGFISRQFFIMPIMNKAKLTVFCPRLYFRGAWNALNTWNDPGLFHCLHITLDEAQQMINSSMPHHLQVKYKWVINKKSDLPTGLCS